LSSRALLLGEECNTPNSLLHTFTYCRTMQQTATHPVFTHTRPVVTYELAGCNSTAIWRALQHAAAHCNILPYDATYLVVTHTHTAVPYDGLGAIALQLGEHCNTLQNTATHYNTPCCHSHTYSCAVRWDGCNSTATWRALHQAATQYNTLQHTATHLVVTHTHTAVVYDGLGAIALRLGELKAAQVCVGCQKVVCVAVCCSVLQCVAVCCSVLQRVAVCCSVL